MTNTTPTAAWTWGQSVATTGTGPTATVEIDVRVPGHGEPEPVVVPLADARVLHAMLGDAIREVGEGGEAAVTEAAAPESPAQLLRRAAAKIRQDAAAARKASPDPWAVTDERVVRCADGMVVADRSSTTHPAERADLPFIAAMHPGVGLALADWLDVCADYADRWLADAQLGSPFRAVGYTVAQQILGEVTR